MIIEVNNRWHYNAPRDVRVGDEVELPRGGFDRHNTPGTWTGTVTRKPTNYELAYDGDIRAIVGKVEPLSMTITATTKRALIDRLRELADDLEDQE